MMMKFAAKSVFRSPVKTILFVLLLGAATAFLSLGLGMLKSSDDMLKQADESFTTVAYVEYIGENYPDVNLFDEYMIDELESFDVTPFIEHPAVLSYSPQRMLGGSVDGFYIGTRGSDFYDGIIIMRFKVMYNTEERVSCILKDNYFGSDLFYDGVFFYLDFDNMPQYSREDFPEGSVFYAHGNMYEGEKRLWYFFVSPLKLKLPDNKTYAEFGNDPLYRVDNVDEADSEKIVEMFHNASRSYNVLANQITVRASDTPQNYLEFFLEETKLVDGAFFTDKQISSNAKVCLISQYMAGKLGIGVGDSIDMELYVADSGRSIETSFWYEDGFLTLDRFTVVGIFKDMTGMYNTMFIPLLDEPWMPKLCIDYSIARVQLNNDEADKYVTDMKQYMLPSMRITTFDQGYAMAKRSIVSLQETARILTYVSAGCTVALLLLFAYMFIAKNRDIAKTMLNLGTGRRKTLRYLMYSALIVLVIAIIIGGVVGYELSQDITRRAYEQASTTDLDLRFSNIAVDKLIDFSADVESDYRVSLFSAVCILILGLAITYVFALGAVRAKGQGASKSGSSKRASASGAMKCFAPMPLMVFAIDMDVVRDKFIELLDPANRLLLICLIVLVSVIVLCALFFLVRAIIRKSRILNKPRRMSLSERAHAGGFTQKIVFRSIFRGKWRSAIVPPVAAILVIFIGLFCADLDSYQGKRETVYDDVPVTAYLTNYQGKLIDGLRVPQSTIDSIVGSGYIAKTYGSVKLNYLYSGIEGKELTPVLVPTNSFAYDTFYEMVLRQPMVVGTNNVASAPEFFFAGDVAFTFLDGYDESCFEGDEPVCMLNKPFMEENGIALGDTIVLTVFADRDMYVDFTEISLKVVGIYPKLTGRNSIYSNIKSLDDTLLTYTLTQETFLWFLYNRAVMDNPDFYITDVRDGDMLYSIGVDGVTYGSYSIEQTYRSVSFVLKNTEDLDGFKDAMEELGLSSVGRLSRMRLSMVINEEQLQQTITMLDRHIAYMQTLFVIVYILTIGIGFVVSYLLTKSRRPEFAMMRSMGAGKGKTFFCFFAEQTILFIVGSLLGAVMLRLISGTFIALQWQAFAGFALCYLVGIMIAAGMMNRLNVLETLGTKE